MKARLFDMNVIEPIVGEDYDLAIRIQKAGFKIVSSDKVRAQHYTRHVYKRTLLAIERGPQWWGKLVENGTYFFAKHYDVLGIFTIFMHTIYNAFFSPLALLLKLRKVSIGFFIKVFLYSVRGSFIGFIRGLLGYKSFKGVMGSKKT